MLRQSVPKNSTLYRVPIQALNEDGKLWKPCG